MENITLLKKKRGNIKHKLTSFKTYLNNFIATNNLDEIKITELKFRINNFESIHSEFESVQSEIEMVVEEPDLPSQHIYRSEFESEFYSTLAQANHIMTSDMELDNQSSVSQTAMSIQTPTSNTSVKLPAIQLPQFNGNYESWLGFRDTFMSLIHDNDTISPIQKYHYLRACLEGSAYETIRALEFSASVYESAWNLVCNRFNNSRSLIRNHVKAILSMPTLYKENSKEIRTFTDSLSNHLSALKGLKQPVDSWNTILLISTTEKLDKISAREWEGKIISDFSELSDNDNSPSIDDLVGFLRTKANLLEQLENRRENVDHKRQFDVKPKRSLLATTNNYSCYNCKGPHAIWNCEGFLKMNPRLRNDLVKQLGLCFNCLSSNHSYKKCKGYGCKVCKRKHNTLLHAPDVETKETASSKTDAEGASLPISTVSSHSSLSSSSRSIILLSTAVVNIVAADGNVQKCRALLDSGSESSFITKALVEQLGLETEDANISLIGINLVSSPINYKCSAKITSTCSNFTANLELLILSKLTSKLPLFSFDKSLLNIPNGLSLADPYFNESDDIDLLIGSDIFWKLIQNGNISLGKGKPTLQNTSLGWIISGALPIYCNMIRCNFAHLHDIDHDLKRFWELEENLLDTNFPPEQSATDINTFFENTLSRDSSGKFIVQVPFNDLIENLGDSRTTAQKRLFSIERRFGRDNRFKNLYKDFMLEYLSLEHTTRVHDVTSSVRYFLPHHGVLKEDKSSTRLRVVFDGSARTSTGVSLNEAQLVGPTIQNDLFNITLRFRQHQYVMSADVKQMYRQVIVHPDHRRFQSILWRDDTAKDVEVFELNTVTYGTSSAPYLAIRCLYELASEFKSVNPLASRVIQRDFYVDDLLTGDDNRSRLVETCKTIVSILQTACFELRKFVSNDMTLAKSVASSINNSDILMIGSHDKNKTLGICWSAQNDNLYYQTVPFQNEVITKRSILSAASKIFDPLGLLSPIIIKTKILLQKLWSSGIDWDEPVPCNLKEEWKQMSSQFALISSLIFPRCVIAKNAHSIELHGFCDASKVAYGACVFVKSTNSTGHVSVQLLCAKSRVAPLKAITIPRLELCGALILTRLMNKVKEALTITADVFYWCDSQVVLHWLNTNCNTLNIFVRNRVSKIQLLSDAKGWSYVRTKNNPADIISRGATPTQLKNFDMWWKGPLFLYQNISEYQEDVPELSISDIPELKKNIALVASTIQNLSFPFERFSNFHKMIRVVSFMLRFKHNCLNSLSKKLGPITIEEFSVSLQYLIKIVQSQYFSNDIAAISNKVALCSNSKLLNLTPFLDNCGILRVGGRLKLSNYHFDKKHPILLPKNHVLSTLIMRHEHIRLLHSGPQQMVSSTRDQFWILSGRTLAKGVVRDCLICFKGKAKTHKTLMGNLPKERISQSFPFEYTGIDYAGPFLINDRRGRGAKRVKTYICLYVCMSTKCIHLEVVGDLSTENFIANLRRFTSRRGLPAHVYSDNGRNFVGAQSELQALGNFLVSKEDDIIQGSASLNVQWHFIPPYSPHFGGLWESNIKSMKSHLYKILQTSSLVYEEFQTVIIQIEAVLNSRPLGPLSTDPNDPRALTPSHLLIGRPLTSVPDPNLLEIKENQLSRFQYIQSMVQRFWYRWQRDYLNQLQVRSKWKTEQRSVEPGMLVIIKDLKLPPRQWRLGRVQSVHRGQDNIPRVLTLKTVSGVIKRAVTQICLLPISDND